MPYVSICIAVSMAKGKRWMDSGLPCCRKAWEVDEEVQKKRIEEWIEKSEENTEENY